MMEIQRPDPKDNFARIPNALIQDERLSWAARGLLIELLSRPEGWQTKADAMWERSKRMRPGVKGESRDKVRALFTELETLGYIDRGQRQGENGQINNYIHVFSEPLPESAQVTPRTEYQAPVIQAPVGQASIERLNTKTEDKEDHVRADAHTTECEQSVTSPVMAELAKVELNNAYDKVLAAAVKLSDADLSVFADEMSEHRPSVYASAQRKATGQATGTRRLLIKTLQIYFGWARAEGEWLPFHTADEVLSWFPASGAADDEVKDKGGSDKEASGAPPVVQGAAASEADPGLVGLLLGTPPWLKGGKAAAVVSLPVPSPVVVEGERRNEGEARGPCPLCVRRQPDGTRKTGVCKMCGRDRDAT